MTLLRHPSAFLPLAMSLAALALVIGYVSIYGIVDQADEGTPAHLYQLLMAGQVPIIGFFIMKWMTREPEQAIKILALQIAAGSAALAALLIMEWSQ